MALLCVTGPTDRPDIASYTPATTTTLPDVATDLLSYKPMEHIADPARGVKRDYSGGKCHPEYLCTRDQMAVYVAKAFGVAT